MKALITGGTGLIGSNIATELLASGAEMILQANIKAGMSCGVSGAFNIGNGTRISMNALVAQIGSAAQLEPTVTFGPPRPGDVRHSLADIGAARAAFGFEPLVTMEAGLPEYLVWARTEVAR